MKSRLRVRTLEDEVEKPMNVHRWRALEVCIRRHWASVLFFYARQHVVLSAFCTSVCPSVLVSLPGTDPIPGETQTLHFHRVIVSSCCDQISCRWARNENEGIKEGYPPLRNRYFAANGSSSMRTVADRHRRAAYQQLIGETARCLSRR